MQINTYSYSDAIELMGKIEDNSIDVIFLDPPMSLPRKYHNEYSSMQVRDYLNWCEKWMLEAIRIAKPSGSIFIHSVPRWLIYYATFLNTLIDFRHWIVWNTTVAPMGSSLQPSHYGILYYSKDRTKTKFYELRAPHSCCKSCGKILKDYGGRKNNIHPFGALITDTWSDIHRVRHPISTESSAQLPVHLLERILLMSTDEGDVILDPFARVGTTGVAAKRLNRQYILGDLNRDNVTIGTKRIDDENTISKIDNSYVSFFDDKTISIRDLDWENIKRFYELPKDISNMLSQSIHPEKGNLFSIHM